MVCVLSGAGSPGDLPLGCQWCVCCLVQVVQETCPLAVNGVCVVWCRMSRRPAPRLSISPQHKHWPAGPAHFSDRRTSSGQYILSVTGPYGPPRYMSGHQISNSAGPNGDNSQCVFFARSPVPHLGSFRTALLLQRDASVSRVRVWHVNQTH